MNGNKMIRTKFLSAQINDKNNGKITGKMIDFSFSAFTSSKSVACLGLVIAIGLLANCSKPDDTPDTQPDVHVASIANQMNYLSRIDRDQVNAMNESISSLYLNPPDLSSSESYQLENIMHVTTLSPESLQTWLEARVSYVINADYDIARGLSVSNAFPFVYPEADQIPPEWVALTKQSASQLSALTKSSAITAAPVQPSGGPSSGPLPAPLIDSAASSDKTEVVMSNVGAALYLLGKTSPDKQLHQLAFDSQQIQITSPRTGILKIGPGLFHDFKVKLQNVALDIYRVSTLFHEARHSDGHGETLGFLHSKCPAGSDYAGLSACDGSTNGPYTVGALVMKTMKDSCVTCTPLSNKFLEIMYLDESSRVIHYKYQSPNSDYHTPAGADWDDQAEGQRRR